MKKQLSDNKSIEIGFSSSNLKPSEVGGQKVGRSSNWYRVNDGDWKEIHIRSQLKVKEIFEVSETEEEFKEWIETL